MPTGLQCRSQPPERASANLMDAITTAPINRTRPMVISSHVVAGRAPAVADTGIFRPTSAPTCYEHLNRPGTRGGGHQLALIERLQPPRGSLHPQRPTALGRHL